jgi:hypothetical protein
MKKSSIDGNRYLDYLWELGELPVYIYWWCWRFAAPDSLRSVHSENQGFFNAVDTTILMTLSSLVSAQATPTGDTMQCKHHILNFVMTHSNAILSYAKSNMVLSIHRDASYLSKPKVHSHAGSHFFLSNVTNEAPNNDTNQVHHACYHQSQTQSTLHQCP